MSAGLDFATGVAVLWLAVVMSIVHVVSSPRREHWVHLPPYVRAPLMPAAAVALFRGLQLVGLAMAAGPDLTDPGHAAPLEFLFVFGVNVVANGVLCLILTRTYPPEVWRRIRLMRASLEAGETPDVAPEVEALMRSPPAASLYVNGYYVPSPPRRSPRNG